MYIISSCVLMIIMTLILIKEYTIIQSYHYEIRRYLCHLRINKSYYYFLYCLLFIFIIKFDVLFLILSLFLFLYLLKPYKLKITKRIKRLFILHFLLLFIFIMFGLIKYVYIFSFFYLFFLHSLSLLIEEIIFIKYLKSARRKINGKFVIGVTGSCGKTSVKNMIYDVLINKFNVSKTPKSFNNKVGIVKGINDEVNRFDDYFICEYGVDKKGVMDKLIDIVKPKIAIVTQIGNQHLLTFKSVSNILHEKIKLIERLDEDGVGIINNDNKYLRMYNYKNKSIIRYGIDNDSDVMAKNIITSIYHSEFDLYIKGKFIKRVKLRLLSRHSVENALAVVSVLLALKLDIDFITKYISSMNPISHRLEYKIISNIEIIDDAFNSNIKGFKEAIDLLCTSLKYKIVITPGIIEQGDNNESVNREVASYLLKCDFVCLVSDNSKTIKKELIKFGFNAFKEFNNFNDAFEYVKSINENKIVLIENDLPDIYLK